MRILHILDHSLPLHSGYSFRTASILGEQRALGWETHHLTTPRQGSWRMDLESVDGWDFLRTRFTPGLISSVPVVGPYLDEMRATAARVDGLIGDLQPDVLHAHSPVLNALPTLWVGRKHKIPVVYEMRASWEDAAVDHGTTPEGSIRYRLSRALETFALKHADAITTICEGLRRDIAARGIDADRVAVIPNAVDANRFAVGSAPDPVLRARLGLERATVLGFVGSFYHYEGLDLLVDAAAQLAPSRTDLRVLLVGGGPRESALRAQAARLGLSQRILFAGRVPHDEVPRYYDLMDVLVYPRRSIRLTEIVTPLKPLEAMAQGRILLASDVGGHRELIRDGDTGHLFAAGDVAALARAIERILSSREPWDEIRNRARAFVENERTWARSVARYAEVYAQVLAAGRGASARSCEPGA